MSVKSNSADVSPFFHLKTEKDPGAETMCYILNTKRRTNDVLYFEYEKTDKVQIPGKPKKETGRQ